MKKVQRKFKALKLSFHRKGKKSKTDFVVNLPPEVLLQILYWVKRTPTTRYEVQEWIDSAGITDQTVIYNALLQCSARYTLRKCALVCIYWANYARHAMFHGATLSVETYERAESFRHYSTNGSGNLVRVCDLIKSIWVSVQIPKTLRSFLPLLCFAETRTKLDRASIIGPFLDGYPPCKQDSPHWGLSNCAVPSPSGTPWRRVGVKAVRFPSYRHFFRFLSYFNTTREFNLNELSWEGKPPDRLVFLKRSAAQYRDRFEIHTQSCRDNVVMGLQVALMYPDCPLRSVTTRDQDWAVGLMKLVGEFYQEIPPAAKEEEAVVNAFFSFMPRRYKCHTFSHQIYNVPREYICMTLQMICDMHPGSRRNSPGRSRSPTKPRIRGLAVIFKSLYLPEEHSNLLTNDISMMQRHIESNPSLRFVVFTFESRQMMESLVERYPSMCQAVPRHLEYVLACQHSHRRNLSEHGWLEINRHTLEPTGKRWGHEEAVIGDLLEKFFRWD